MTVKRCDRCGRIYTPAELHHSSVQFTDYDSDTFVDRDLCPRCTKDFHNFMNNQDVSSVIEQVN